MKAEKLLFQAEEQMSETQKKPQQETPLRPTGCCCRQTEPVWWNTEHFWQQNTTQKNIRKNTQVHFFSSSSPSTDYIESLENLNPVILKDCSNCQEPRSIWRLIKILKTTRWSKLWFCWQKSECLCHFVNLSRHSFSAKSSLFLKLGWLEIRMLKNR